MISLARAMSLCCLKRRRFFGSKGIEAEAIQHGVDITNPDMARSGDLDADRTAIRGIIDEDPRSCVLSLHTFLGSDTWKV
jgi:hypothetical protein